MHVLLKIGDSEICDVLDNVWQRGGRSKCVQNIVA